MRSPNYSKRNDKIEFIVIHYTEMNLNDAIEKLCDPNSNVSCHYIISEKGEVMQLVDDDKVAWHAGQSYWKGKTAINNSSIGIELDNLGIGEFSSYQMDSLIGLCNELIAKHAINRENVIGHSDIAPNRKIDPGIYFDWSYLAKNSIGIWHNLDPSSTPIELASMSTKNDPKLVFDMQTRLLKLGYKIQPTGVFDNQTNYVIRAFKSHFLPYEIKALGIGYYNNPNSKYSWDSTANMVLEKLLAL